MDAKLEIARRRHERTADLKSFKYRELRNVDHTRERDQEAVYGDQRTLKLSTRSPLSRRKLSMHGSGRDHSGTSEDPEVLTPSPRLTEVAMGKATDDC